jgi:hypothetical protein
VRGAKGWRTRTRPTRKDHHAAHLDRRSRSDRLGGALGALSRSAAWRKPPADLRITTAIAISMAIFEDPESASATGYIA